MTTGVLKATQMSDQGGIVTSIKQVRTSPSGLHKLI